MEGDLDLRAEFQGLVAGVRAVAAVIAAIFIGIDLWFLGTAGIFAVIYRDMLNGMPLPWLTRWIVQLRGELLAAGVAMLLALVWAAFGIKNPRRALYLMAAAIAVSFGLLVVIAVALFSPLCAITQGPGPN